jgi:hypothetical protein
MSVIKMKFQNFWQHHFLQSGRGVRPCHRVITTGYYALTKWCWVRPRALEESVTVWREHADRWESDPSTPQPLPTVKCWRISLKPSWMLKPATQIRRGWQLSRPPNGHVWTSASIEMSGWVADRRDSMPSVRAMGKTPESSYKAVRERGLQRGRGWQVRGFRGSRSRGGRW